MGPKESLQLTCLDLALGSGHGRSHKLQLYKRIANLWYIITRDA